MTSITTDYHERIQIPTQDVIPKSRTFNCLKYFLLITLMILIVVAILSAIIAESFVKPNKRDSLAIGIVAVVGICLFIFGIIGILKEHIPLVLCFSFSLIIYLLIFMYSRIFNSPGWIVTRTLVILTLAIGSFTFAILIREWRYLQMSKLNHSAMKQYAQQYQQQALYSVNYEVPGGNDIYNMPYEQGINIPYQNSQLYLNNPQPQVFINGLPNQDPNQIRRQNMRKGNQQVTFQNDPYPGDYNISQQQQYPQLGQYQQQHPGRLNAYSKQPLRSNQLPQQQRQFTGQMNQQGTSSPYTQRNQQPFSRVVPPYVDLTDDNPYPEDRTGQIYYK